MIDICSCLRSPVLNAFSWRSRYSTFSAAKCGASGFLAMPSRPWQTAQVPCATFLPAAGSVAKAGAAQKTAAMNAADAASDFIDLLHGKERAADLPHPRPASNYWLYEMRYTAPAKSSETRSEPSRSCAMSTGRPIYSPSAFSQPTANSSCSPAAVPSSFNGVNSTRAPTGTVRFHEPCWAVNTPFLYLAGNLLPV